MKFYHSAGFCKINYFIFEAITFLSKIQNHSKKLSNYGSFSKIGRKNHYLEILKSKIGRKKHYLEFLKSKIERKNHYLDVLIQRLQGETTTLKFCRKVVEFSFRWTLKPNRAKKSKIQLHKKFNYEKWPFYHNLTSPYYKI